MDRDGIAARLRGLIAGQNEGDLGVVARRLGVDEVSLRMSVAFVNAVSGSSTSTIVPSRFRNSTSMP